MSHPEPTEREVDEVARRMCEQRWGDTKNWNGRRTNRAFYRRLARAEIARRTLDQDDS